MKPFLFLLSLFLASCLSHQKQKESDVFNEKDYAKVQGIILDVETNLNGKSSDTWNYTFLYDLNENPPKIGKELGSELLFDAEDPVAIMVHKRDSTKMFVAHRDIIDEELLLDYLLTHEKEYNELIMDFRGMH